MSEINITDWLTLVLAKFMAYRQKLIVVIAYKNGVTSIVLMPHVKIIEQTFYIKFTRVWSGFYDFFELGTGLRSITGDPQNIWPRHSSTPYDLVPPSPLVWIGLKN